MHANLQAIADAAAAMAAGVEGQKLAAAAMKAGVEGQELVKQVHTPLPGIQRPSITCVCHVCLSRVFVTCVCHVSLMSMQNMPTVCLQSVCRLKYHVCPSRT